MINPAPTISNRNAIIDQNPLKNEGLNNETFTHKNASNPHQTTKHQTSHVSAEPRGFIICDVFIRRGAIHRAPTDKIGKKGVINPAPTISNRNAIIDQNPLKNEGLNNEKFTHQTTKHQVSHVSAEPRGFIICDVFIRRGAIHRAQQRTCDDKPRPANPKSF